MLSSVGLKVSSQRMLSTQERLAKLLFRPMRTCVAKASSSLVSELEAASADKVSPLTSSLLSASFKRYEQSTPSVQSVLTALRQHAEVDDNSYKHDHFAYRTLGLPGLGIESLENVLKEIGYVLQEDGLKFPAKKLVAAWYAYQPTGRTTTDVRLPRIFVSEIKVEQLSAKSQHIIKSHAEGVSLGPAQVAVSMTTGCLPWRPISEEDYRSLAQESDYAAWVMVHGYTLNHTALSVHDMRPSSSARTAYDIHNMTDLMRSSSISMNPDGGYIKQSPDGLLLQSSTMSDMVTVNMAATKPNGNASTCNVHVQVPGSYLELVERRVLPQHAHMKAEDVCEHHRRDGFEVGNASHLFTSTKRL